MRRAAFALALTFLFVTVTLAADIPLQPGTLVPGAQGVAKLGRDDNGNTVISVEAKHLAPPSHLTPPKNYYVVWIQPRDQQPQIAGVMTVDPKKEEAAFKTPTAFKNFDVTVTAEDNPRPDSPSGPQILKGTITAP